MKNPRRQIGARKPLSDEAQKLRARILADYEGLEGDTAGLLLLDTALEAFDRMREAQAEIARDGVTVLDRWKQRKAHPATVVERDSRSAMVQALRALNLDLEPLRDSRGRPPGGRG